MDVTVGLWRKLSAEKLMVLNCGVGEDSWESLFTARRSNQSILKKISPGFSSEGLMLQLKLQYFGHLMRGRLKAGGEGDDRGWDGWVASPTWWAWVWVNSGSWWWTGRPGVLRFMGSQRVGHAWVTKLDWTGLNWKWELWFCVSDLSWSLKSPLLAVRCWLLLLTVQ